MAHKIAKLILEHAASFVDRKEAIRSAIRLGMPLHEIEEYLDWLDLVRSKSGSTGSTTDGTDESSAG